MQDGVTSEVAGCDQVISPSQQPPVRGNYNAELISSLTPGPRACLVIILSSLDIPLSVVNHHGPGLNTLETEIENH